MTELVWCTAGRPGQDQLGDGGEGSTSVLTGSERSNVALPCHLLVGPLLPGVSSSLLSPRVSGSPELLLESRDCIGPNSDGQISDSQSEMETSWTG